MAYLAVADNQILQVLYNLEVLQCNLEVLQDNLEVVQDSPDVLQEHLELMQVSNPGQAGLSLGLCIYSAPNCSKSWSVQWYCAL